MHTYSICFQLFPFKHRLIADKTAPFKVLQLRFACPVTEIKTEICQIELPQAIIETFARFLVPEIRKYYDSEQGQRDFTEWQDAQGKTK